MTEEAHVADQIQIRRDTASNWSSNNPTLAAGEQGWESDTNKMKVGDGTTAWNSLSYFHSQGYQSSDAQLTDIAGLTPTDGNFIVGDGSNFVTESGVTVRASLGLTIGTDVQAYDAQLADIAGLNPTDGNFIVGDGSNFVLESGATARTSLGLGTIATAATSDYAATANNLSDLANASTARTNLGVAIGTDVQAYDAQLADIAGLNPTDGYIIVGDGSNFVTENGATARTSLGLAIGTDVLAHDANLSSFVSTFTLPTSDGSNGQALITDGSGTLSFSTISGGGGGGGGSFTATASGSLSDGSTVIVNSDGTVSVVAETSTPAGFGSATVFESGTTVDVAATFDSSNNKVVVVYADNSNSGYGTAVVGTVSGTSISFGTPVVFESASTSYITATFDSNSNKVVIAYRDGGNSNYSTGIVGTVSGTSISFGTPAVFRSAATEYNSIIFDSNSNKVVIAYYDEGNSYYGTAVVGTVSGTSISFGTPVVFRSATCHYIKATFDSNSNKVVIAYRDDGSSYYGRAIVGTVSGTSISFGSPVTFNTASSSLMSPVFDSNSNKVVIAYRDGGNSNYGTAIVGTVSGTSISFGSETVFESDSTLSLSAIFDSTNNKVIIAYKDGGNSNYGTAIVGTVSGTSISFGSATVFESASVNQVSLAFDSSNDKVVIAYQDNGNSNYGTAIVYQPVAGPAVTNLTTENYAGISDGAYSNAATATIQTAGSIDDAQSGLTAGQAYYVQEDGTLATTPDTTSVFAGIAINSTSLLIGKSEPDTAVAYADITGTPTIPADVSDLTDTTSLLGGGSGLQQDFTANGAITSGKAVILESAGTVAQIGETTTARDYPETSSAQTGYGSGNYVLRSSGGYQQSLYIAEHSGSTKKMIHMFTDGDSSGYPKGANVRIIAYDGSSYTLGTRVNISGDTTNWNKFRNTSIVSTSTSGTFLIFYTHLDATGSNAGTDYTKYRTLTYSGTTITLGSEVDFDVDISGDETFHVVEDPHQDDRYVVAYRDNNNSSYYTIRVLTNSSGTISYGTKIALYSGTAYNLNQFKLDPKVEGRYLLIDGSSQTHIRTGVINYSANSATCGSAITPGSGATQLGADWDPFNSGKIVASYDTDWTLGQRKVHARVGTYSSGTNAVSFTASAVAFPTNSGDYGSSLIPCEVFAQPGAANQFWSVKQHEGTSSDYFYVCAIEVSDTTPSITEYTAYKRHGSFALDCKDKQIAVIEFNDPGALLHYGYSKYSASNIAEGSFIGFASETVSDAGTVTVDLTGGTTTSQSSLTIGSTYYVQDDGSVGTTVSSTAEVFAGKATAADTLLIGVQDSSILKDSDIGSAVQAYSANYLLSSAVGSSVQAYDSNLTSFVSALTLPTSDGSADQVLKTDGSGTLSFSTLSSGAGSFTATADGAISDGDTIIIQSDGTVKSVAVAETFAAGTAASPGTIIGSLMIPDTSTALVFWSDSGIKCAVATITASTNAISLGATQTVTSNAPVSNQIHPVWDPDTNRAVLFYRVTNTGLVAIAMSISGNTVTAGTQVTISSNTSDAPIGMIYDTNRDEYIAFGVHQDNGIHGYVGTISGTTLTFGSGIEVEGSLASNTYYYWNTNKPGDVEWDPVANRFYIVYNRWSNYSGYTKTMYHKSGSSSGTAFSFGSTYSNGSAQEYSQSYSGFDISRGSIVNVGENKFAIGGEGRGGYTSNYTHSVAIYTVNSSSYGITKGSDYTPHSGATSDSYNLSLGYNSDNGKIVASIYDNTNSNAPAKVGTISGTTITFGDAITTSGGSGGHYWDYNSSIERYILNAQIINQSSVTNVTTENYIGISDGAYSDGATATVQIVGSVDDAQSGLTPGQAYYVQGDGTLGTTADTPSVFAGTAVSSTKLIIKG